MRERRIEQREGATAKGSILAYVHTHDANMCKNMIYTCVMYMYIHVHTRYTHTLQTHTQQCLQASRARCVRVCVFADVYTNLYQCIYSSVIASCCMNTHTLSLSDDIRVTLVILFERATHLFFRKGLGPVKALLAVYSGTHNLLGDLQLSKYWSNTPTIL